MPVTVNGSVLTQTDVTSPSPSTLTYTSVVLAAGDVLVSVVAENSPFAFGTFSAPTGGTGLSWTQIILQQNTAGHFTEVVGYWTKIPSDQTSTITVSTTNTSDVGSGGALLRLSGVDQVTPIGLIDGFQGQTDPTGTDLQLAGTNAGSLIIMVGSDWSAGTAALTVSISNTTGGTTDLSNLEAGQFRAVVAHASQSGSTNQGTLDYSAATGDWAAIIFEVKAAPTEAAPPSQSLPLHLLLRLLAARQQAISAGPAAEAIFPVDADDSTGLTDSAVFQVELVREDSAGLTDTATTEIIKAVTATDSAGLTDSVLITQALERSDTVGLTDSAALTEALERTDSTGLTDSSIVQVVKAVTASDQVGLTDSAVFTEILVREDSTGLTDSITAASTFARTATDTTGLTDAAAVGILRAVDVTDQAGLTDSAAFAYIWARGFVDPVGLTDEVVFGGSAGLIVYGSAALGTEVTTTGVVAEGRTTVGKTSTGTAAAGTAATGTSPQSTPGSGTTTTGKPGGEH